MIGKEEKLASLKLMAALSGVEVNVRDLCQDFLLLTYDLPCTEEGNKARAKFLQKARQIGCVPHTESVFYMPATPEAELAAIEVAEAGNAFIWISSVKDEGQARELTEKYDAEVGDYFKEIQERIAKAKKHAEEGKEGIVERMKKKTDRMIVDAAGIAARRGSEKLAREVDKLKQEADSITVNTNSSWVSELKGLL